MSQESKGFGDDLLLLRVKVLVDVVLGANDCQRDRARIQELLVLENTLQ